MTPNLLLVVLSLGQAAPARAPFVDINPSWSPDGQQLALESSRHGRSEIYVVSADGRGLQALTSGATGSRPETQP